MQAGLSGRESLAELQRIGAQRGYQPGWAMHVYEARRSKRAASTFQGAANPIHRLAERLHARGVAISEIAATVGTSPMAVKCMLNMGCSQ